MHETNTVGGPFMRSLCPNNLSVMVRVIRENEVLDLTPPPDWEARESESIQRKAQNMADCVAPMLRCATRILFVDPYFRASRPDFRKPLKKFLQVVAPRALEITAELHTSAYKNAPTWDFFQKECKDKLPYILPDGVHITVYRWRNRVEGETLHNRYILTDVGGVSFNNGLDEGDPGTTDDVSRLSAATYAKRWGNYAGPNFAFDLDDKVIV